MADIKEEKVKKGATKKTTPGVKKTTSKSATTKAKTTTAKKTTSKSSVKKPKETTVEKTVIVPEVEDNKTITENTTVDRSKQFIPRIAAYVIDMLIIAMIISLLCAIKFINPNYEKYTEATTRYNNYYTNYLENNISINEFEKNTEKVTYELYKYGMTNYIVAFVVMAGYLVVFQKYNHGQTIGKKLLKLKVTSLNEKEVSLKSYAVRIAPMFLLSYGGIFSIIACIILPQFMGLTLLGRWISAVTIANIILGLVDVEFAIVRKDRRTLHDLLSGTKIISEEK